MTPYGSPASEETRVGVDVGGTFTDIVATDGNGAMLGKLVRFSA